MFQPVDPKQNFPKLEEETIAYWKEHRIFEKSIEQRKDGEDYVFYDGPPFATGLPHYGHLLAGTMKDVVPRYWTMKGKRVERRFGWDCHGLPVEYEVEKELGLSGRKDIVDRYGVSEFCEKCRSIVLRHTNEWRATVERMARWVDMDHDYKTMDPSFMESIWWVFGQLWDKNLIYEGYKAMHICPRCVTPLSNFEVTLGYKEVTDPSVIWKFKVKGEKNTYLLAWTTTPWSTLGTMGLSVGPHHIYLKVKVGGDTLIFAKERLDFVLRVKDYEILEEFTGKKLVGLEYEPISDLYLDLPEVRENKNVYHVYPADYVEVTEGTGIVTINGAYGEIDMQAAQANGLPILMDVNMEGRFTEIAGPYAGLFVKEAEGKIVHDAMEKDLVCGKEPYKHTYPHCWRCDSPLLNYATSSWFVKVEEIKDKIIANNHKIHWVPSHVGEGRFEDWLKNARDWCISRNRFWGTPLPVWRSEDGETICIKSIAELEKLTGKKVTDLHKHLIDDLTFERDGKLFKRIPEVLDCWFEAGSMPYAQMHYPFENQQKFEHNFPAEFIAEGLDQTRGWFYTLLVLSTALFDKPAFKNVIVNGLVLAEDGKKMSKRLKNYPEPQLIFDRYGADAMRFYLMNSPVVKAEPLRFSEKGVDEIMKNVILPLWNGYSFFVTYARIDGFKPEKGKKEFKPSAKLDRWILSELHLVLQELTEHMDRYDLQRATEPIVQFMDGLTNWYIRRSRRRFWKSENDSDKLEAYQTLYVVLTTFAKILAPFMPCVSEVIYRNLTGEESVHLSDWPVCDSGLIDRVLNDEILLTQQIVQLGHRVRSVKKIKVRQPLSKVQIVLPHKYAGKVNLEESVIAEELNVKTVEFLKDASQVAEMDFKPDPRKLGPKYGAEVQTILKMAKAGDAYLLDDGRVEVGVYQLEPDEVEIGFKGKEGYDVASEQGIVVALDTVVTPELQREGMARDVVRLIQDMRKKAQFNVDDRIVVGIEASGAVERAIRDFEHYIRSETLAESFEYGELSDADLVESVHLEEGEVRVGVKKFQISKPQ